MARKIEISREDSELFRQSVGEVKPVRHGKAMPHNLRPPPIPRQKLLDEARVRNELLSEDTHVEDIEAGEELMFLRPGVQHTALRKLRRGHYSIQNQLDLHGMTVPVARKALAEFLGSSRSRGMQCVRIIHGKGLNSRNQLPVLKGKLDKWLKLRNEVLAFCSAPPADGGVGVVYVLLKHL